MICIITDWKRTALINRDVQSVTNRWNKQIDEVIAYDEPLRKCKGPFVVQTGGDWSMTVTYRDTVLRKASKTFQFKLYLRQVSKIFYHCELKQVPIFDTLQAEMSQYYDPAFCKSGMSVKKRDALID